MPDYIIAAASTADLPAEYFREHNIPFISYTYMIGDKQYDDNCEEKARAGLYGQMRAGAMASTSMINTYSYIDFFRKLMETGKDVIFLDMTKRISHSFVNAREAAQQIKKEYPSRRLYVMDTLCVSGGLGMLLCNMVKLREEGASFEGNIDWAEKNKLKVIHWFTVNDLKYLKSGGRVSNSAAMIGTILSIKPILCVSDEGELVAVSKVRGRKAALMNIISRMKEDFPEPDGSEVFIHHADCEEDAQFVKKQILANFPTVSKVTLMSLGAVVGSHCGPGLLAVFYMGEKRAK